MTQIAKSTFTTGNRNPGTVLFIAHPDGKRLPRLNRLPVSIRIVLELLLPQLRRTESDGKGRGQSGLLEGERSRFL